jgi:two-component system, cell cycle sensor histidine kinase and response regulator CckA
LLVDDELICDVCKFILTELGPSVLTAADEIEGVKIFRQHLYDIVCVLLDVIMPKMDGKEALHEMRQISTEIPVLLSSGGPEQGIFNRFAGKKFAAFLQRPYSRDSLLAKVHGQLED